jgi:hypothetical protein
MDLCRFVSPEALALKRQNAHLSSALDSSRRVGGFLLKNEEKELEKIKQLTGELLAVNRCFLCIQADEQHVRLRRTMA